MPQAKKSSVATKHGTCFTLRRRPIGTGVAFGDQSREGERSGAGEAETAAYKPLIQRVMAGEVSLLLYEEPVGWAITRGTTGDESKFIPMTPTDLRLRIR